MTRAKPLPDNLESTVRDFLARARIRKHSEGGNGMAAIRGVEIFAAGIHRNQAYTEADLDAMAANFNQFSTGARPALRVPAVLGHDEEQELLDRTDLPAAGWCERVYRDGPILKADFADVPPQVARLLQQKAYRKVSAEVYDEPPEGVPGKGKMLRRVAFLGGEIPQVKSLDDIPAPVFGEQFDSAVRRVVLKLSSIKSGRTRGLYQVFSEVSTVDRKQLEEQAAALGLTPETVALLQDDALAAVVLNLLAAGSGAAVPPPEPPPEEVPEEGMMAEIPVVEHAEVPACPAATPAVPAQRQPTQVVMKYAELEAQLKRLSAAVNAIEKNFTTKVANLDKFAETRLAQEKRAGIKARLDVLVQQGKVLPAELDAGLADTLFELDALKVKKFSENGKQVERTALDKAFLVLESRPSLAKFAERVKGGKGGATASSPDEELEKVQRYAEDPRFQQVLKAMGQTSETYVAKFSEAKKKVPALTAAQYGVPSLNGAA